MYMPVGSIFYGMTPLIWKNISWPLTLFCSLPVFYRTYKYLPFFNHDPLSKAS